MLEADDFRGTFEFRPLEPGYGTTIGNALRRVLLSSLEGYAITSVQIDGVDHEFSSLPGVVEDMTDIILRLKQIRFRRQLEDYDHEKLTFTVKNQTVFKAGDLNSNLNGFQVLNPDLEICHMEASTELRITLSIDKGRGYVPADENKRATDPIGVIAIDSIHTPIKKVMYAVDDYRVGIVEKRKACLRVISRERLIHRDDRILIEPHAAKQIVYMLLRRGIEVIRL